MTGRGLSSSLRRVRAISLALLPMLVLPAAAHATEPVAVARVYPYAIGNLSIDFTLGNWTFSSNGRGVSDQFAFE